MILLTDVATKLEELLNSYAPSDFSFIVKSAGYHLDSVSNKQKSRNQIPVFISMVGGEYNPVPNLHQINTTYEINIYYPVRFKEAFYNLNSYLESLFVGKKITFDEETALCNISVAEYGEIIQVEAIRQFENWIEEEFEGSGYLFKKDEQINEFYMSMRFRLFATTLGDGFLFGNDVKTNLSMVLPENIEVVNKINIKLSLGTDTTVVYTRDLVDDIGGKYAWKNFGGGIEVVLYTDSYLPEEMQNNVKVYFYFNQEFVETTTTFIFDSINEIVTSTVEETYLLDNPTYDNVTIQSNSDEDGEQILNATHKEISGAPQITSYNSGLLLYYDSSSFCQKLLEKWCDGNSQELAITVKYTFREAATNVSEISFTRICYLKSVNITINKGEPVVFTLSFAKRV